MDMEREEISISVTILTGFLGAGKTTYLNHLLEQHKDKKYAIIENEFGEVGVDNELIIKPDETIVELNNGCLCCTLNDNLYDILNELYERRTEFDEIIIEATGVADPAGLAEPFIAHPLVKKHFPLKSIVCLVDAELIEDQLVDTEEAMSQVTFSDILLVNKTDLISEHYLKGLKAKLSALNPLARIAIASNRQFPAIALDRNNDQLDAVYKKSKEAVTHKKEAAHFPVQKPHHHHHHQHTQSVNSLTFTFEKPFDLDRLRLHLSVYLSFQSKGLYRIKGLVYLKNEEEQFILQSVGKRFDFSKKRVWQVNEKRQSVLVFIGKNLQRKGLERILLNSLAK